MITANIGQIPNQPIVFSSDPNRQHRSEDAMVAYTWAHFLNDTTNPEWLARLPMTKACVRAMDTVQAFAATLPNVPKIDDFAVMGGSKRGWTTWTTAAVDPRVRLFIPIVIPVLDLQNALNRLYEPYGAWSFVLADYINTGVMPKLNSPQFAELAAVVDPLVYNERFAKRPHYIVCGTMDEFFLPDSANLFWDRLVGPKMLRIVPNADHGLIGQQFGVVESVNTFIQLTLRNEPVRNPCLGFFTFLHLIAHNFCPHRPPFLLGRCSIPTSLPLSLLTSLPINLELQS
jgi:PhoPQ-activated pathogenicity-related protein